MAVLQRCWRQTPLASPSRYFAGGMNPLHCVPSSDAVFGSLGCVLSCHLAPLLAKCILCQNMVSAKAFLLRTIMCTSVLRELQQSSHVERLYDSCSSHVVIALGTDLQGEKVASKTTMLRVSLAPAPPTALTAATTAHRIMKSITVQYQPSGAVARRLTLDPRTLGKITSAPCTSPSPLALENFGSCMILGKKILCVCVCVCHM